MNSKSAVLKFLFSKKWILVIQIFFFFIISCNKTTTKENLDKTVKELKVNTTVYPHEKDFFKGHGQNYLENKTQCLSCHGADGSGGTAKVSCLECHKGFPHPRNWATADQHSADFMKSPQSCSVCHGDDWKGGKSKVSCLECHANYPHPLKWAAPQLHGKAFKEVTDKKQCLNCHDSNKTPSFATKCASCHKAYPHVENFEKGKKHKEIALQYEGQCTQCHQGYKSNMPNFQDESEGAGCFNCHEGKTEIQWIKPEEPKEKEKDKEKTTQHRIFTKSNRVPSNSPHDKIKKK